MCNILSLLIDVATICSNVMHALLISFRASPPASSKYDFEEAITSGLIPDCCGENISCPSYCSHYSHWWVISLCCASVSLSLSFIYIFPQNNLPSTMEVQHVHWSVFSAADVCELCKKTPAIYNPVHLLFLRISCSLISNIPLLMGCSHWWVCRGISRGRQPSGLAVVDGLVHPEFAWFPFKTILI